MDDQKEPELNKLINYLKETPTEGNTKTPLGYIRCKVYGRNILVKTLIDSGNLYADLISEELAKKLKIPYDKINKEVGTASQGGSIKIIGRAKNMKMFLEGIKAPIVVHPYIVPGLAQQVNLGQTFLRTYQADMIFRPTGTLLKIGSDSTKLVVKAAPLSRPSIDTRILPVINEWKKMGANPEDRYDILDARTHHIEDNKPSDRTVTIWNDTKYTCYVARKTTIPAQHSAWVSVRHGNTEADLGTNNVVLVPKRDNTFLNSRELHVHPGAYAQGTHGLKVLVTNFSSKDCKLPLSCKLGHLHEAVPGTEDENINVLEHKATEEMTEAEKNEWRRFIIEGLKIDDNEVLKDKPDIREQVINIFMTYREVMAIHDHDFGQTDLVRFNIELKPGAEPVCAKLRPLNPIQERDLERQISEWLKGGVIEETLSPWASALVPCQKRGSDKLRWAIDYRALNALTVKDNFPLPNIEVNLHKLAGSSIFSAVDSKGAFHNIIVEEASRPYTAFITPQGAYHFRRCPFGVQNAPSLYARLIQKALSRLPPGFALAYVDDIIIHSASVEEHVQHLRQVIELHSTCGMKLNLQKCSIMCRQVEYLGHIVDKNGIAMIPSYVDKINSWPLPETGKELRSFLGFTSYYRSFIKEYADLTFEMNKLKNAKGTIPWTREVTKKFEKLKQCFNNGPVRGYPRYDTDEPFIIDCDWSSTNLAAVLSQKQEGKERFLGCVAKKCNRAEQNYSPHKGELASLVLATKRFEHILRAKPFLVRTDSSCVKNLATMKECRGSFARMQLWLSGFNYEIQHRAGKRHTNADALSRRPGVPEEAEQLLDLGDGLDDISDVYNLEPIQEITKEELQIATKNDVVLKEILQYVKDKNKPDKEQRKVLSKDGMVYVNFFECLSEEEGILYFQAPELNGEKPPRRICLPPSLWETAFVSCHVLPTAGHYGINNTYRKMKQLFFYPHMHANIQARVTNCIPCLQKRKSFGKPKHTMHRERLSYFGQRVYVDTVGPIQPRINYKGTMVQHFMTMLDGWSRWLVAEPISTPSSAVMAEAFIERWVYFHGCPEVLHSDRGSGFTSELFKEVMKQLGICKTITPSYAPEGDRVERCHATLGGLIRATTGPDAKQWAKKLKVLTFAYNTTVCRATGCSPFEAVYGHKATLPVDLLFPFDQDQRSKSNFVENLKLKYQEAYAKICKNEQKYIALGSANYQGRSPITFHEGDLVFYFLGRSQRGLSRKLTQRWIGPWKVVKRVSESLVVIFPEGNWATNPKEVATIVSRLRKVDPQLQVSSSMNRMTPIDMSAILDDVLDMGEDLSYSDDFVRPDEPEIREVAPPLTWMSPNMEVQPDQPEPAEVADQVKVEGNNEPEMGNPDMNLDTGSNIESEGGEEFSPTAPPLSEAPSEADLLAGEVDRPEQSLSTHDTEVTDAVLQGHNMTLRQTPRLNYREARGRTRRSMAAPTDTPLRRFEARPSKKKK